MSDDLDLPSAMDTDRLADFLDATDTADLMAAVARRKERRPYDTEAELLAQESSGWAAIGLLRERSSRGKAKTFAYVVGPYRTREVAEEARGVIEVNHRIAAKKGKTKTDLVRTEVKPIWKEPT